MSRGCGAAGSNMEWQSHLIQDHAFVDCMGAGLPREIDIQQLIRDTEEKLKLNACCIEQSLRELQAKLGDTWTGERPSLPGSGDSLQWFSPHSLGLLRPISASHQALLDFLRALQQYLRMGEDGREDVVLQLLFDISCQCGVAFPSRPPLTSLQPTLPSFPLHGVHEETALDVQEAWEDVRLLLRRHILDRLQAGGREGIGDKAQSTECVHRLQQLLFLYPETEVLSRYQSLRAKAVEDLLQGTQVLNSGETGFQRLAHSLQSAAPTLLSMLREDMLTLSAVVELNSVVAFANQAYLSTITHELLTHMEKLCENALKDNSTHSNKAGKNSTKSKVAVGTQDQQKRVRSFCLTSHQLQCLTQLTVTLQEFEEGVEELLAEFAITGSPGELLCGVKGILKKSRHSAETATGEGSRCSADLFLQQIPEPVVLEFNWRSALRDVALPMAHCVKVVLEDVCSKSLQQEQVTHTSHNALLMGNMPQWEGATPSCQESKPPRKIAKFCEVIIEEVDRLFPLALVCQEDPLLEVRSSFVEVCGHVALALLRRLEERAGEVPSIAPLKNLPLLLATIVHIHQQLEYIHTQLQDGRRVPLSLLPLQKCQDLMKVLHDQLTGYCVNTCATSILQDPEAHHWGDAKPFYEGERCSFSIQMWHYFLCGLSSDLWVMLPPHLAQKILSQVLNQTLEILVQRYSHACPTYRRSQQIRVDITTILLCVEQMIWSVCDSLEDLLQPNWTSSPWISSIHSLCNQLLGVLFITTAPLQVLCSVFQGASGGGGGSSSENQGAKWLTVINPVLFPQQSLQWPSADELATHRLLRLTTSQPSCNLKLVLLTILHDDCVLLRLLLSNSYFCVDVDGDGSETREDGDAFMEALFSVLTTLNNIPRALALVLETYFDKRHLWDHLYSMTDVGQAEPVVLKFLRAVVTKPIAAILNHIVTVVQAHGPQDDPGTLPPKQSPPECVLHKVPKEWNYMPCDTKITDSQSQVKLMMQVISFIFTNLPSAVASLPLPVRFLFHMGEKHLSQHARQLKPTGLLLWSLLSCLCHGLEHQGRDTLMMLSECLQAAMGQQKGVPKPMVQKVLQGLEESRPKWISMQLQKARKLCAEGVFKPAEGGVALERGSSPELTEQKIRLMLLEVCHKPGGTEYLRQIYHIIRLNEDLLKLRLSTLTDAQPDLAQSMINFNLDDGERYQHTSFNPLTEFNHIGDRTFSQSAVSEWNWDWARLLPSYLGMSQVTFRALLENRWEMQDAAPLEDEEKTLVDHLQKAYFNTSSRS